MAGCDPVLQIEKLRLTNIFAILNNGINKCKLDEPIITFKVPQREVLTVGHFDRRDSIAIVKQYLQHFGGGTQVLIFVSQPGYGGADIVYARIRRMFGAIIMRSEGVNAQFTQTVAGYQHQRGQGQALEPLIGFRDAIEEIIDLKVNCAAADGRKYGNAVAQ